MLILNVLNHIIILKYMIFWEKEKYIDGTISCPTFSHYTVFAYLPDNHGFSLKNNSYGSGFFVDNSFKGWFIVPIKWKKVVESVIYLQVVGHEIQRAIQ